jgi:putative transposase
MAESVRFDGIIKTVTISHEAGQWHASFCIDRGEIQRAEHLHPNDAVGVDLGIKHFATLSDGNVIDAPMPLKRSLKKLARLQRSLSRKTKGSKNRTKAKLKISRLYLRIRSIRKDFLHKFTSWIVKKFGSICIEDLNVSGMIRNHCLARSISDLGWYEFRIMLEYKSLLYGAGLWMVDRFYPSSQTCSSCGSVLEGKQKLKLSERIYKCPQCNLEIDRDLNAALNLKALAV